MNLKEKFDQENDDIKTIVPLDNNEIKSILKTQAEAVFQDRNLTNNSNFIKKSLIDIALDFKSKDSNDENSENKESFETKKIDNMEDKSNEDANQIDESVENILPNEIDEIDNPTDQLPSKPELVNQNNDEISTALDTSNPENDKLENIQETDVEIDKENASSQNQDQPDKSEIISEIDTDNDETQQALESVRDAVSKSLKKSNLDDEISIESKEIPTDISEIISEDFKQFKNIFSSLSNLSEEVIYKVVQSKIIDIAYELAGYQIDKMPEKYEKKIRSLIKNINCFEDKMKIEINDQDYNALSKIENFFDSQDKSIFISNKDLSRGDIILNCDGMHYSEKSNKTK
mgnify:CR=1 FL=1